MSEFWIVTDPSVHHYSNYDAANAERVKLQAALPDKQFCVIRCKKNRFGARHFPKMVDLLRDILERGLTDDLASRARILLGTIGYRSGLPKTLVPNFTVPEFKPRQDEVVR